VNAASVDSLAEVTVYGHWICPFATRVEFALAQRAIAHDQVNVPPTAARPKGFVVPDEFVAHSPKLEIPLVRIGREWLADSIPILEWMESRFDENPLLPDTEPERALVRDRMRWVDEHLFPSMIGVYYQVESQRIAAAAAALSDAFGEIAQWLEDGEWLAGEQLTLVEAVALPVYVRLEGLRRLGFRHQLPSNVEAHRDRCSQLVGWPAVAWTDDHVDEFVGRFEKFRERRRLS